MIEVEKFEILDYQEVLQEFKHLLKYQDQKVKYKIKNYKNKKKLLKR